jgi:hypothetical protein
MIPAMTDSTHEDARKQLDCAEFHAREDSDGYWYIGFNCPSATGGFLTFLDPSGVEQPYVTREELEWLRDVGIPAWLREMDTPPTHEEQRR